MRFVDQALDNCISGYPCISSPRWSTDLALMDSGAEQANQRWAHPLHRFRLPEAIRDMADFNVVRDHWLVMRGPLHIWPWRDPLDFASVPLTAPLLTPAISSSDEPLGTGDGLTRRFPIYRTYAVGAQTYRRRIELPVTASVVVAGLDPMMAPVVLPDFTVSRPGGEVIFDTPVDADVTLTCGFLFDVPVRFESDDAFEGIVQSFNLGGHSDLTFIETRVC